MRRFLALDALRGIAALTVAVYHLRVAGSFGEASGWRQGWTLVTFFFILSGFVIAHAYLDRLGSRGELRHYLITRACRIYPLHLFMLGVFIALECAKWLAEQRGLMFNQPSFSGARAPGEILPNLMLLQSWWPGADAMSFNYPAWSISVEFYLYLVFAALVFALPAQVSAASALLAFGCYAARWLELPVLTPMLLEGLGCFFAGVLVYRLYRRVRGVRLGVLTGSLLELAVTGTVLMLLSKPSADPVLSLTPVYCLAVLIFAFEAGGLSRLLTRAPWQWLGQLSYSIYLVHAAVLLVVTIALGMAGKWLGRALVSYPPDLPNPVLDLGSALANNLLVLTVLGLVLLAASVTYPLIERPGMALGKRWAGRSPRTLGDAVA